MVKNFWKNKKVLITGHEGFLGSNIAKALLERGSKVIGVDKIKERSCNALEGLRKDIICVKGDISDLKLVKRIVETHKPRVMFHIAAEAIVGEANKNPVGAFKSNIEGTWNILDASRGKKFIDAIVVASSDKAYGSHKELPYKEETALRGKHPYDVSKSCADLICHAYWNTYKVPVCVTRCGNIYGPGDFHFSRIVPDAVRCALKSETLLIRSDGEFTRDYVYVEDVVNGYIALAEKMKKLKLYGEAFNFSCEDPITVIEMVKAIFRLLGKNPDYKILNKVKYEIKDQFLCSRKARKVLDWKPGFTLNEGLKKTIEWYEEKL